MTDYGIVWDWYNNYYFLIKNESGDILVLPHIGSDKYIKYIKSDYKIELIFKWDTY